MKKYVILGHKNPDVDSIVSGYLLEKLLKFNGYDVSFVIPDDKISEETYKILSKFSLNPNEFMRKLDSSDNNFILVDHSERDVKRIVGIIDHHPNIVGNNDVVSNYPLCNIYNDIEFLDGGLLKQCFEKLAAYEDIGTVEEFKSLKEGR